MPASSTDEASVTTAIETWLGEARKLRGSLDQPSVTDTPRAVHKQLLQARGVLDRVEEIVARLIRLRGRLHHHLLLAQFVLEDAESKALGARRVKFTEYTTRKERYAWLASETVEETAIWRNEQKLYDAVDAALDEARLLLRGVDSVRRDADTRLRIMSYERQLER